MEQLTLYCQMSPNLTGISDVDLENMRNSASIELIAESLSKGGNFVTKVFRGPYDKEVFDI